MGSTDLQLILSSLCGENVLFHLPYARAQHPAVCDSQDFCLGQNANDNIDFYNFTTELRFSEFK